MNKIFQIITYPRHVRHSCWGKKIEINSNLEIRVKTTILHEAWITRANVRFKKINFFFKKIKSVSTPQTFQVAKSIYTEEYNYVYTY